jgi:hypothetical protein
MCTVDDVLGQKGFGHLIKRKKRKRKMEINIKYTAKKKEEKKCRK